MKTLMAMATALLGTGLDGADERRLDNGAALLGIVRASATRVTIGFEKGRYQSFERLGRVIRRCGASGQE
jgi:hypothetical protein